MDGPIFFWPNGRLLPRACHVYSESFVGRGSNRLSWSNFSASYEASEFCWKIAISTTSETVSYRNSFFPCFSWDRFVSLFCGADLADYLRQTKGNNCCYPKLWHTSSESGVRNVKTDCRETAFQNSDVSFPPQRKTEEANMSNLSFARQNQMRFLSVNTHSKDL